MTNTDVGGFDKLALEQAADEAFKGYQRGTASSGNVRSGAFIRHFEDYCEAELRARGLPPSDITIRGTVVEKFRLRRASYLLGGHYLKNLDLTLHSFRSGPLLGISLKSMLSSVAKNVNNRWEEAVGDAANLHARFPMLSLGFLMILPSVSEVSTYRMKGGKRVKVLVPEPIIGADGEPTPLARTIARKLQAARGRDAPTELPSYYEEVALAVFSYPKKPIRVHPTFPAPDSGLRVERFVEQLVERLQKRNPHLWTGEDTASDV